MTLANELSFQVPPLRIDNTESIQKKIDLKTKPLGALGKLEPLAKKLALILGSSRIPEINALMLVFAADHGIADEEVSIAPSDVTQQMVMNFLNGGAAINCFCAINNVPLKVINAGVKVPLDHPDLINQAIGLGTQNFSQASAMTQGQLTQALLAGVEIAEKEINSGVNVIGIGEMGIGNSSSASAIMAAVLKAPADECVGRGTGINDEVFARKLKLVAQALLHHQSNLTSPFSILQHLGGFEIAQMVGAILQTAMRRKVILVDGFIATAAAMLAVEINSSSLDYMVFCHESDEQGHRRMLNHLKQTTLLNLNMRLGEGTGAALAVPMLRAAAKFYNDMASFEDANIDNVVTQ